MPLHHPHPTCPAPAPNDPKTTATLKPSSQTPHHSPHPRHPTPQLPHTPHQLPSAPPAPHPNARPRPHPYSAPQAAPHVAPPPAPFSQWQPSPSSSSRPLLRLPNEGSRQWGARARSACAAFSAARAFPGNQHGGAEAGGVRVSNVRPSSYGPFHPISSISSSPRCSWWCSAKPRVLGLFSLPAGGTRRSPGHPVAMRWAAGVIKITSHGAKPSLRCVTNGCWESLCEMWGEPNTA